MGGRSRREKLDGGNIIVSQCCPKLGTAENCAISIKLGEIDTGYVYLRVSDPRSVGFLRSDPQGHPGNMRSPFPTFCQASSTGNPDSLNVKIGQNSPLGLAAVVR